MTKEILINKSSGNCRSRFPIYFPSNEPFRVRFSRFVDKLASFVDLLCPLCFAQTEYLYAKNAVHEPGAMGIHRGNPAPIHYTRLVVTEKASANQRVKASTVWKRSKSF